MKKIFLKQYNALFDYPIVENPGDFLPSDTYAARRQAYNKWLQSKKEIAGEHHFEDGKTYEEDVDFFLKEIGGLFDDGEGFETEVAIPID